MSSRKQLPDAHPARNKIDGSDALCKQSSSHTHTNFVLGGSRAKVKPAQAALPERNIKINSPFSIIALHTVFSKFGTEKRAILETIGFSGLTKVHKQRLPSRKLILSLLRNMDPKSASLELKNSAKLTMQDKDVNIVLGIPYSGKHVKLRSRSSDDIQKVKAVLMLQPDSEITIEAVRHILLKDYGRKMEPNETKAFKVAAILYADSCFIGPRGEKGKINKDILSHLADPSKIIGTNWAAYVISVLRESSRKVQQSLTNESILYKWRDVCCICWCSILTI